MKQLISYLCSINHLIIHFGQVASCKRAILERGWNPLNYRLLDHPLIINLQLSGFVGTSAPVVADGNDAVQVTGPTSINSLNATVDINSLNTSSGVAGAGKGFTCNG